MTELVQVSQERFEEMIDDALDNITDEFAQHMRNVVILAHDRNPDDPTLLGLYEGVPLPERTFDHTGFLPDAIFIYKEALEDICTSEEQLAHEVYVTVMHEVGHFFGLDEDDLHRLGYE